MLNKNEMNGKANAADVDVDLLVAGIGEMLDGIRHCLKATDLHSSSTDSDYILMVAALPGKGIQVMNGRFWCWMVGNIWSALLSSMMWTVTVRTFL